MKHFDPKTINWPTSLFLCLTPPLGILLAIVHENPERSIWLPLGLVAILYTCCGLSITAGYHRLFAHRTYQAVFPIRLFFTLFGAAAFQTSILNWCTGHRLHHRFQDTMDDPYSINKGFWYAHFGWMLENSEPCTKQAEQYARDLMNDPLVMWQHNNYLVIASLMSFALPMAISFCFWGSWADGLIYGGLIRLALLHHSTFFINSLCHYWGSKPYDRKLTARDNPVVAMLTFGEGYHNFHHCFANDYRNGVKWYQFDPSKWLIAGFSYIGWTWALKTVSKQKIQDRQIQNQTGGHKIAHPLSRRFAP